MKIAIDIGHNVNYDGGAIGILNENTVNKEVGNKVIDKLRALGHTVYDVLPIHADSLTDSLSKRVLEANQNRADIYVSIHANMGGGKGSEVYAISDKGREIAKPILNELCSLGYYNRGIKESNLFVLRHTNMPAILVELFFLDNQGDCNIYNPEALANAIVKGLTGQTVSSSPVNIEGKVDNMNILDLQKLCNEMGVTDYEGKTLVEDGLDGPRTQSAKAKLKAILQYVLS